MSLYTWSVASDVGTAAYLNAMFSALMTNLGNGGWAQTLDSGQINLTTNALYPSSANQSIGYQIWQMQDGLQTTYPIFIKFEFGSAASASLPAFWLTIGTSSDGAGNITGILFARTQYSFAMPQQRPMPGSFHAHPIVFCSFMLPVWQVRVNPT